MTRAHEKGSHSPFGKSPRDDARSCGLKAQDAVRCIEGRWKIPLIAQLSGASVLRYSELYRALRGISHKMLAQQLRELERDAIVLRIIHAEVPPRVEYSLTDSGRALVPALRALVVWSAGRPDRGQVLADVGGHRRPTASVVHRI
jgi:DNA-binding HxlR family transcriptional regulator